MESHPLNLAHQQHRRAEALLINNRFDEAMQCHHNAAELLLDAMKSTASSVALESITLQHSYHLKQKDLIKSKKEQYARVLKAMDNLKLLAKDPLHDNEHSKIQIAIYRTINENDSLLNMLSNNDNCEPVSDPVIRDVTDGKKIEKSQHVIVEELQILSQNLQSLVEQLVFQVEVLKDENVSLKERVNFLEKERIKYLNIPTSTNTEAMFSNFSNISIGEAAPPNDVAPMAIVPLSNKIIPNTERFNHPHFDLSALKDD